MEIKSILGSYLNLGYSFRNAQNLAAEEIVLTKISSSSLCEHVTLKGGIVMFTLTKNKRRVTQDIDFDFIRYSIDKESIKLFVEKLNEVNDGISASISGSIEQLHQEDYQGVRIHLILSDSNLDHLKLKLDIGVHTYSAIEQNKLLFTFSNDEKALAIKVNPPEQIASEKLLSLARFGKLSTRYKDLYDMYYLISNKLIGLEKVNSYLNLFLSNSKKMPKTINELVNVINETLDDKVFASEASIPSSNWLDVQYKQVRNAIKSFVSKLK